MTVAKSRVTAQGQISIPAEIRRKLGIGPGSVLEWQEEGGQVAVVRSGSFSSEDIHTALFGAKAPETHTLDELREGIKSYARRRHARS